MELNPVVWQPDVKQIQASQLSRFTQFVLQTQPESQNQLPAFTGYTDLHHWSVSQPDAFWRAVWDYCGLTSVEPATAVLGERRMPGAQWFPGMTLNFAQNLLRLAEGERANDEAVVAYCETRSVLRRSYAQLKADTGALEAYFRKQGVAGGDRVAAIVTNGYEALVAMLATTSMGATFSSASPDFGVGAILDRFSQIEPSLLVMVNGYGYGGKVFSRTEDLQAIRQGLPSIKGVVVIEQLPEQALPEGPGVVSWEAALQAGQGQAPSYTPVAFDHPAYILFSSGTTGKPKCIVHGTGGILLNHAKELMLHGDIGPGDRLMYFTTCGWMMWNWQASGLLTGARLVTVDGSPGYPNLNFLWDVTANEGVTHFGTSARFIAGCRKANLAPAQTHQLQKVRVVFSTGSPLLPEDYDWFYSEGVPHALLGSIAGGTDICGCFVGCVPTLPVRRGEIQGRMLGADVTAFDEQGHEMQAGR
ncbi:MAG TPA: acetoacetate--CoA ligase, partial [Pusillimonas sp.]|nr:acetoacetate--CoA ligase [Pusillimonas sp.]